MSFDLPFSLYLQSISNPFLDKLFIFFTSLGNAGIFWILFILALLCFRKTRYIGVICLLVIVIDYLTVEVIKHLVERLRPFQDYTLELLIKAPKGYSFPSAHASIAFSIATTFFLLGKEKPLNLIRWIILGIAILIAFSRIYLFVHYLSDVLVGAVLGILIGFILVYITNKYQNQIKEKLKLSN